MLCLAINRETHDINLDADGKHFLRVANNMQMAAQASLCLMKTEEGESFVDGEHGIPWLGEIAGLPISHLDLAQKIIREKLENIRFVDKVEKIVLRENGRNLGGTVTVRSCDGIVTEEF